MFHSSVMGLELFSTGTCTQLSKPALKKKKMCRNIDTVTKNVKTAELVYLGWDSDSIQLLATNGDYGDFYQNTFI